LGKGKFCPDCVKLVEGEDAMPKKRCNSKHVKYFIFIPPRLEEISSGNMLVDGEEMDFETWRIQLKKEWGLDAYTSSDSTTCSLDFRNFLLGLAA
jgi:hypothetical protein